MKTEGDLSLRLVQLTSAEKYPLQGGRLVFIFARDGGLKFTSGRDSIVLEPGAVVVAGSETGGSVYHCNGSQASFHVFSLRVEHLFPLFEAREISALQAVLEGLKTSHIVPPLTHLAKECHRLIEGVSTQRTLGQRGQLLSVAAALLSDEFGKAHSVHAGPMTVEGRVIDTFEKLSNEDLLGLSADQLAEKFGCSRRHLNRLFHQYFGLSVATLRMEMRLLKAISLLRDPNIKIIDVAERCDFNHLGLFNTCFKRRFGFTPGAWRKRMSTQGEHGQQDLAHQSGICPLHSKGLCPMTGSLEMPPPAKLGSNLLGVLPGITPAARRNPPNGPN